MNARDALAALIDRAIGDNWEPANRSTSAMNAAIADAVLAAGWRAPIETEAALFTSTRLPEFERLCREGGSQIEREIALMDTVTEAMTHIRDLEGRR